jgi:hypothetical protein
VPEVIAIIKTTLYIRHPPVKGTLLARNRNDPCLMPMLSDCGETKQNTYRSRNGEDLSITTTWLHGSFFFKSRGDKQF